MARGRTVFNSIGAAGTPSSHRISNCFLHIAILLFLGLPSAHSQIEKMYLDTTDLELLVDETHLMKMIQIGEYNTTLEITAQIQHTDIVQLVPQTVEIPGSKEPNTTIQNSYDICAYGKSPGHSEVTFNVTPSGFVNLDTVFLRITVMHSHAINVISYIMGWIYFAAWSVSFYPQIYINFKRKSVVGLNFDFLALNIMGFTMYSLFNCGLYFSKEIQGEYFSRHPRGLNPVQLNDVFFSLHAAFATLITIAQCFLYEREDQRVSITARGILGLFCGVVIITLSLALFSVLHWLDFLYYCSYIKLSITLIKYVPQAYMNYKRKSTVGWSIGNIFLDFVGGSLSVLQMALNAYNYNDWVSFFGDATKFGLGLFSLVFDIFFILQHYVFYRRGKEFMIVNYEDSEGSHMTSSGEGEYFLVRTCEALHVVTAVSILQNKTFIVL
ncbi:cystinosin homolog isoform X1 [Amyelois transitella]|uniref:cystinosin homolog isoform X1 n=1 Tax=Amyelois transitella TaxID=680683 RepID=UPI00298F9264|nr:cystinosin homolog isoform X1 [Amyelois transitella]XP_060800963.1 cystinosin homolog isoform X1 [Amyelois transitella]